MQSIFDYSNPTVVYKKAIQYLGDDVNIRFSNNEEREIRFETVDEAWKYHDELKDKLKDRAIEI